MTEGHGGWPDDVEVPLRGGFVDFGELTADDLRAIADDLDEHTYWGHVSAAAARRPATDARLWRSLAAELENAGVERVRELAFEVRAASARALRLPERGWALPASRRREQ